MPLFSKNPKPNLKIIVDGIEFAFHEADGASWGDWGVDFTIQDRAITDESWGD